MLFPAMYNKLFEWRSKTGFYVKLLIGLILLNFLILLLTWFLFEDGPGYNRFDDKVNKEGELHNQVGLGWYLFSPFWMLYFVMGSCTVFLNYAYRPAEKTNKRVWGYVADGCTLIMLAWGIAIVSILFVR